MKNNNIVVKNASLDYSDYYAQKKISPETRRKFVSSEFLAIPARYGKNEFYFAQETIDFIKFCRNHSPEHSFDVLADDDIKIRSLHSFDIWMPIIFIAQSVLLPFAINMVSNYIWEKMKGRETENAEVDMTFIVKNGKKEKSIHYKGDAKTFKESFEKIDLNKMWEE